MNLLWRILRLLGILLVFLIRMLLPVLLVVLRAMLGLVSVSFAATVNGPTQFADQLAGNWTRRLLELGAPRERIDQLYNMCRVSVSTLIMLGWLISIVFTVVTLRVVFGFFI